MFEELNKIKKSSRVGPSKMDGISSPEKIADHFGEIYKNIYKVLYGCFNRILEYMRKWILSGQEC